MNYKRKPPVMAVFSKAMEMGGIEPPSKNFPKALLQAYLA